MTMTCWKEVNQQADNFSLETSDLTNKGHAKPIGQETGIQTWEAVVIQDYSVTFRDFTVSPIFLTETSLMFGQKQGDTDKNK